MAIKALLVAVSEYRLQGYSNLPLCINDLYAMKDALLKGINVKRENIFMCGEKRSVNKTEFLYGIRKVIEYINLIFVGIQHISKNDLRKRGINK